MAMDKMIGGLSEPSYRVGLEPVGQNDRAGCFGDEQVAVSRRFVAMTETALADLLAAPLGQLDLVALMIDGVHFGRHLVRRRAGDQHRRHQTSPGAGRRQHREHDRGDPICSPTCASGAWTRPAPILVGIDGGKGLLVLKRAAP